MTDRHTAVITGATRGIGLGIADYFASKGYNLAICGTSEAGVKEAVSRLEKHGVKVYGEKVNVTDNTNVETFINNILKEFGNIDVVVNNAGITKDNLVVRMNEQDWDDVIDVNLKGTFLISKHALKAMMKARKGSIINITSVVGQSGNAGQANYSASKAGIIGLTKSLAKEFASRNIRVNAVAPGFVKTEMTDKLDEKIKESVLATVPLKRFAEVTDIAKAVMFLASEDASYITGQILAVNGGLYI
ncbi:3-oxoacyl-[acyl-carrier protein] reductase [Parelusimicrobium proximum]|uniref:3-oxoacyl-[acyl-carrier-protein] reductase n=1 Tax=Parelusimicrobium proximum TaxID=3228953 RepID=UPI003D16ACF3